MRIVGETFGKLRVLYEWLPDRFVARCECGEHVEVFRGALVCGAAKCCLECSPGSRLRTTLHVRSYKKRDGRYTQKTSREHNSWANMVRRCTYPKHHAYADYGGRGIRVCKEWLEPNGKGFLNFLADMGPRPRGMTLDRIDVQDHYRRGNCKWATWDEQGKNRRPQLFPDGNIPPVIPLDDAFSIANDFEDFAQEASW